MPHANALGLPASKFLTYNRIIGQVLQKHCTFFVQIHPVFPFYKEFTRQSFGAGFQPAGIGILSTRTGLSLGGLSGTEPPAARDANCRPRWCTGEQDLSRLYQSPIASAFLA